VGIISICLYDVNHMHIIVSIEDWLEKTMTKRKTETKVDSGRCNCTGLRKATRRISQLYDKALAPSGMKVTQRAILAQINRFELTSVGLLADTLVMDAGALAHTLKPLERGGLIAIEVDPDDRRHRLISLTAQGRAKLEETNLLWTQAEKNFESVFGRAEAESLRTLLQLLVSDDFASRFEKILTTSVLK
jgi:DNA-binding MarR family transcriptional regulator